ncbi:hypothetical protein [Nocardia terpenica]|uniref:CopG family transcriptional regulator n=1 Tax=Nocardia terpenica TaxID=455432 RepID=A0A6G9YVN2_9NOCA|nr:hypothetical protein [Nocardia terpenica]QIS17399.1 hypothetical protein F6W96_02815 [Nocardia terpenica]
MSTQIAIRFDDDELAFIDAHTDNRSAYIKAAVRRERKRRMIEDEIIALSKVTPEEEAEIAAIVDAGSRTPLDVD